MDAAATTEAGRVSLQRKLLGEKKLCFRKSPKENGIKRRSRFSTELWNSSWQDGLRRVGGLGDRRMLPVAPGASRAHGPSG